MIVCTYNINALDNNFGWTIGSAGFSYDVINNEELISIDLLRTDLILAKRISFGVSMFSAQFENNGTDIKYAFLPIEVGFIPLTNRYINISLYGRGALQFAQARDLFWEKLFAPKNKEFFGAVGIRLFVFAPDNGLHYSWHSSVFFEYTTLNELKMGITLDPIVLGAVITGFMFGISKGEYEQKMAERERIWDQKPVPDRDRRDIPR
jgi:hypothetical protein